MRYLPGGTECGEFSVSLQAENLLKLCDPEETQGHGGLRAHRAGWKNSSITVAHECGTLTDRSGGGNKIRLSKNKCLGKALLVLSAFHCRSAT